MSNKRTPLPILYIYLGCGGFFLLMELAVLLPRITPFIHSYLFDADVSHLPLTVWPGLLAAVAAQILLVLIWVCLLSVVANRVIEFLLLSESRALTFASVLFFSSFLSILLANQISYPNSVFADITGSIFSDNTAKALLIMLLIPISLCGVIAAYQLLKKPKMLVSVSLLTLMLCAAYFVPLNSTIERVESTKPNVFIIGVDSLRPDFVNSDNTPNLYKFINKSVNTSQSVTPLARTFPAWVSILTGKFAHQHGARYDLINPKNLNLKETLAIKLQRIGYTTVYASDESSFSNIDKSFGFDNIVTPPMGFNDFALSYYNDFPLSNLISNTVLGEKLFPYNYANRNSYITYHPQAFVKQVSDKLSALPNKPVFLALHFCLSHWPYEWADWKAPPSTSLADRYQQALHAVDQQLHQLILALKQKHLLQNSLVIVLSDHGEALNLPGDRLIDKQHYAGDETQSPMLEFAKHQSLGFTLGHGTDVLSPSQYQTVFALQRYPNSWPAKTIKGRTSLIDIMPTVLTSLGINAITSGINLLPYINSAKHISKRYLFTESGYSPEKMQLTKAEIDKLIYLGLQVYRIEPSNGHLVVKDHVGKEIIANKQRAVIYGNWLLALYKLSGQKIPVLVNLQTKQWTDNLRSQFALHSPADTMYARLSHPGRM